MSINTYTLLELDQKLSEEIGDFLEFDTTTNIGAGVTIVSTALKSYDYSTDDYFNSWWVYITEGNNITVERQISDYATSTGTLTVRGANLAAEAAAVTCRLYRFRKSNKTKAINKGINNAFPDIYKKIENLELITGNILPPFIWTSSSALYKYTTSNITLAKTTTGGLYWNGESSAKATASADNGYITLKSDNYPRLLDLMDYSITYRCWAHPEVADEATLVIYTKQADATAQTLTSATSNPAGEFSLLKLDNQNLNDDLVEIEFRMKVATDTKYAYFGAPRAIGFDVREYLLPQVFQDGEVLECYIQASGNNTDWCDDLRPQKWYRAEFDVISDGTDKFLYLPDFHLSKRIIKLVGITPLGELSADTGTITLDTEYVDLLIKRAETELWKIESGTPVSQDVSRWEFKEGKAMSEYHRMLLTHRMSRPAVRMKR